MPEAKMEPEIHDLQLLQYHLIIKDAKVQSTALIEQPFSNHA